MLCVPIIGPDSRIQNQKAVRKLLSTERDHERWPLYPWSELRSSSIVFGGELILVHTKVVPPEALQEDVCAPIPWCKDCSSSLFQKSPVMPMFALAAGLFNRSAHSAGPF